MAGNTKGTHASTDLERTMAVVKSKVEKPKHVPLNRKERRSLAKKLKPKKVVY